MARHGAEFWRGQLEGWHRSDLTQRDYCASHGLSEKSFYRWRAREKESIAAEKSSLTLVPISFGAGVPATSDVVRIHSPGGWRIELPATNAPWLTELLRQLP